MNSPDQPPTPAHDIANIPLFAFIPGLEVWIILLLLAAVAGFYVCERRFRFVRRIFARRARRRVTEVFLTEFDQLMAKIPDRAALARLSLLIRGFLEVTNNDIPFRSMSAADLRKLTRDEAYASLRQPLLLLTRIEEIRYAPQPHKASDLKELLEKIRISLRQLEVS